MADSTVAIDRSSLELPPLTITGSGSGPFLITADGLGEPATVQRTTYADPSPWVSGSLPVSSVLEHTSLPLEVEVVGSSPGLLRQNIEALRTAIGQFSFVTTVTVRDVPQTWRCDPGAMAPMLGSRKREHFTRNVEYYTVTIPVYPIPGGP